MTGWRWKLVENGEDNEEMSGYGVDWGMRMSDDVGLMDLE